MEFKIPYRINIAGAYLDCIEEPVVTATIDKYLTFQFKERFDDEVWVYSEEFGKSYKTDISPKANNQKDWTRYVDGCITVFTRNNMRLFKGCDIVVKNDLPSGIGISSSAAFIIGIINCLSYANKFWLSTDTIASFGYWVEHDYLNIPCGRMDFKAVSHAPGLWKIDTANISLEKDYLLDNKHYTGLLLYKEQHEHLTDEKFINIVRDIKDAKYNFRNNISMQYINFEKSIVDGIVWEAQNDKLNEGYLGSFLYSSYVNIKANILNEYPHIDKPEGVYGSKLVGSGLKGASFVLINPDFKDELIKYYEKEYNVVECQL